MNAAARPAIRYRSIDQADAVYRACLSLMRLCQLYAFWLLLEVCLRPLLFLNQWLLHGGESLMAVFGTYQPGPPPDTGLLTMTTRSAEDLPALLLVWIGFAFISRLRLPPVIVLTGIVVILFNLMRTHHHVIVNNGGMLAEMAAIVKPAPPGMADAIDLAEGAVFAGWALFHLQFLYMSFRSYLLVRRMPPIARASLDEYREGDSLICATTARLLMLPQAVVHARRRGLTALLMIFAGLANTVNYWLLLMAWMLIPVLTLTVWLLAKLIFPDGVGAAWQVDPTGAMLDMAVLAVAPVLMIVLIVSVFFYFRILIKKAVRFGQGFMRRSLVEAQGSDRRAPILFLRSFLDDQVALQSGPMGLEQWQFDGTSRHLSLDHLIAEEGVAFGPTVALGNPDDPAPPYGVARGYFDHADWQAAAAQLCADASAIIFVLDSTEGVAWEINHIASRGHAAKTLFLLAPGDIGADQNGEGPLLSRVMMRLGHEPSAVRDALRLPDIFGMEVSERGDITLLTLGDPSGYGYLIALRSFLRRRLDPGAPGADLAGP